MALDSGRVPRPCELSEEHSHLQKAACFSHMCPFPPFASFPRSCIVNTLLSLLGSGISVFIFSGLINDRFDVMQVPGRPDPVAAARARACSKGCPSHCWGLQATAGCRPSSIGFTGPPEAN